MKGAENMVADSKLAEPAPDLSGLTGGDIIAFGGTGFVSDAIEWLTRSRLSHVAMVVDPRLLVDGRPQTELQIVESTILNGQNGVQINPLRARLATCDAGERVWVLRLSDAIRGFLNWDRLWAFAMVRVNRDRYNVLELGAYIARMIPVVQDLPVWYKPNSREEVCSELVAELLAAGGLPALRPYETSPQGIAELKIYADCRQLIGKPAAIRKFNSQ
jgi:hypothetical protein